MMFFLTKIQRLISLTLLILLLSLPLSACSSISVVVGSSSSTSNLTSEQRDWNEVDKDIVQEIRDIRPTTESLAKYQLDLWVADRMKQVDDKFLNWYFSFVHQKATQDAVPFAWLAFKIDFLNVFKAENEVGLTPDEIIKKRMLKEFRQKFDEYVLNQEAINELDGYFERILKTYSLAMNLQLAKVRSKYQVPKQDWEKHIAAISEFIHDSGTSQSSLSSKSLSSLMATKMAAFTTVAFSTKIASKLAAKLGSKLAVKGGITALVETGSKFVDPLLIAGLLIWDIADYQSEVSKSRPELRKNLYEYLELIKDNIYDAPDGSIMAFLDEVEETVIDLLANSAISSEA